MPKGKLKSDTLRGALAEGQWLCRFVADKLWECSAAELKKVGKEALMFAVKAGPLDAKTLKAVQVCHINLRQMFEQLKGGVYGEYPQPTTIQFSVYRKANGTIDSVRLVSTKDQYADSFFSQVHTVFQRLQGSPYRLKWCTRGDCGKPFFGKGNQALCGDECRKRNSTENVRGWRKKKPDMVNKQSHKAYEKRMVQKTGNKEVKVERRPRKG